MSRTCDTCGEESKEVYKCSNCGKPFEADRTSSSDRSALGGIN